MKLIVSIIDYSLSEKFNKIMGDKWRINMQGYGSADSDMLELFGLGDNKKLVTLSVSRDSDVISLYKRLNAGLNLFRTSAGIAFALPIDSANSALKTLASAAAPANAEQSEQPAGDKRKEYARVSNYELVITIVNKGNFDKIKTAAKKTGARGGTLIHGLGLGGENAANFLGIKLQPEKDIVLIVAKKDEVAAIMENIVKDAAINVKNGGVCFSVPVDSAFGLAEQYGTDNR